MFKKKEKPIREYSIFDICVKSIYTKTYSYMLTKVTYYESRIEFRIERIGRETYALESFTVSAPFDEARFVPFEVDEETLLWDTKDLALRIKRLPEGVAEALIPGVDFYPNEVMTMERDFAQKYLSPLALSYATLLDGKYAWYYPDGSASPVVFEIPRLFSVFNKLTEHPLCALFEAVTNQLMTFTPGYVEDMGLNSENVYRHYSENMKKGSDG